MKLIKKLSAKKIDNRWESYGLFVCPFCLKEVTKQLNHGKKQQSCGCMRNKLISINSYKHGGTNTKLYNVYNSMKQRCIDFNHKFYKHYGGRGIKICDEWLDKENGYISFRDWAIQNGYDEGLQIDRINNNGNYESNNCRWVTSRENQRNKRSNKLSHKIADEIRNLYNIGNYKQKDLAKKYNVSDSVISEIISNKLWKNI